MCFDAQLCRCCGKTSVKQRKICIYGCGVLMLVLSLVFGLTWSMISVLVLESELPLISGSLNLARWVKPNYPMYMKVYFFDWKNHNEFADFNIKPKFEERGPYIFEEIRDRGKLERHGNGSLTFSQKRKWIFNEDFSKGTLTDKIVTGNIYAAGIENELQLKRQGGRSRINPRRNAVKRDFHVEKTVRELLFDGYDDVPISGLNVTASETSFGKLIWFDESVGHDGRINIDTGESNLDNLGRVYLWNGMNQTEIYSGACGTIEGYTEELWPPNLDPTGPKRVFLTDICRYVPLVHNENVRMYEIPLGKWVASPSLFHDHDDDNEHYRMKCTCSGLIPECSNLSFGVLDVSKCRFPAKIFMSFPHFYLADTSYANAVDGISPNETKHEFSISLEPNTGIPFKINTRLQFNLYLKRPGNNRGPQRITSNIMVPLFWYEIVSEIDAETAEDVKIGIHMPDLGKYLCYMLVSPGIAFLLIGVILQKTNSWKLPKSDIIMLSRGDRLRQEEQKGN